MDRLSSTITETTGSLCRARDFGLATCPGTSFVKYMSDPVSIRLIKPLFAELLEWKLFSSMLVTILTQITHFTA